ncbi:MAG: hypothetical protein U9O87_03045, partial [Verrucomicrobiota bacterium]|nr:hypothetical protein [Verrucomicrobiota bacterium]
KGINIFLSFPFPLTNSLALREFSENFKIKKIQPWIELEKEEILAFVKKSPLKSEIYRYGRPFILATRASIPLDGEIYDQMKNGFKIACLENSQITYLYPKEVFSIPEISNTDTFFDLTNAKLNEKSVSVFNFSTEFV